MKYDRTVTIIVFQSTCVAKKKKCSRLYLTRFSTTLCRLINEKNRRLLFLLKKNIIFLISFKGLKRFVKNTERFTVAYKLSTIVKILTITTAFENKTKVSAFKIYFCEHSKKKVYISYKQNYMTWAAVNSFQRFKFCKKLFYR